MLITELNLRVAELFSLNSSELLGLFSALMLIRINEINFYVNFFDEIVKKKKKIFFKNKIMKKMNAKKLQVACA